MYSVRSLQAAQRVLLCFEENLAQGHAGQQSLGGSHEQSGAE